MAKLNLTLKDRLILLNQYRILEQVDKDEARAHNRAIKILEAGYEHDYDTIDECINLDVVSTAVSQEVYEVLQMYRRLNDAYQGLSDKSGIDAEDIAFQGFDGNNEPSHLVYAEFLNSQGKYQESRIANSHSHTLSIYRRMLAALPPQREGQLTKDEIQKVIAARAYQPVP